MTDQHFQTPPLPPQAPAFTPPPASATPAVVRTSEPVQPTPETSGLPADNLAARFNLSLNIYKTKTMCLLFAGMLGIGLVLGGMMFGGSSPQRPVSNGLQGVVRNPDIRADEGLKRCGLVSETSPCVVYIMNHSRNDKRVNEFFDEAVKLTGRQRYLIEIENRQYLNMPIERGQIAQIKIPRLQ